MRSDLKGQGLGRLLLSKMMDFLPRRGTQRMVAWVLRENKPMRELALALGFVEDREGEAAGGDDDVRFVLEFRRPCVIGMWS